MTSLWSFRNILALSILLRVGLIQYSEWHDAHSLVKYTDIDYRVFSDAAQFVAHPSDTNRAEGLLGSTFGFGNPYARQTYRYTPLLALALTANEWLHPSFGKYLFALCDIINGILIYRLLLSSTSKNSKRLATVCSAVHLLNPMVFSISTRGSSESVLGTLVLSTLQACLSGHWHTGALLLGLSTHWKIYPVIYGVSCVVAIGGVRKRKGLWQTLVNLETIRFGLLAFGSFASFTGACYLIWGYPFIYETYLYHLHRLDHRHNFSPYFYLTYLTYPSADATSNTGPSTVWDQVLRSPLVSFVPQMTLALGTGLVFGRKKEDLPFAWFVQTYVFVLFNKVCTSQYFLWYLIFVPLLVPYLYVSRNWAIAYAAVWIGSQALWLSEAYKLEFLGQDVFFGLWIRGLAYVAGNAWVLGSIMQSYKTRMPKVQ